MKLWCPRCQKEMPTWKDSWKDADKNIHVTVICCKKCNAVLKIEKKKV